MGSHLINDKLFERHKLFSGFVPLTMNEITPIALCIATADLFDTKRFQANFADNIILRVRDRGMERELIPLKRELNSPTTQLKFINGHKTAIISNMDKILALLENRYSHIDMKQVQNIVVSGKELMAKVLVADNFDSIGRLEPLFRNKILLPTHSLFVQSMKRVGVDVV